ncbi:hypothetical protein Pelo_18672 [Pelomyxa schiedti]|nr:hypothetical protein Pelo_18672 [Pelomyxa schiedti]
MVGDCVVVLDLLNSSMIEDIPAMYTPACIRNSSIVLLCFSLVDKLSLLKLFEVYLPSQDSIVFLVGLKVDLVPSCVNTSVVTIQEAVSVAMKMNAYGYFQCSSKLQPSHHRGFWSWLLNKSAPNPEATTSLSVVREKNNNSSGSQPVANRVITAIGYPDTTAQSSIVDEVPPVIWRAILEYLDLLSLIRVSRTSRHFYHLTMDPCFAKTLTCCALFPVGFHWNNPTKNTTSGTIFTSNPFSQ